MMRKLSAVAFALVFATSAWAQSITGGGGGGGGGGSGTVTSVDAGCGTATSPAPITTSGTVLAEIPLRTETGTTDTVLSTDCGGLINYTNAGAKAITLPQAGTAGFAAKSFFQFCNQNTGTATITPTTSTIGGAATYPLTAGTAAAPSCVGVVSDGTNYQVVPSGGTPTTDASLLTSGTLAAARLPAFTGDCTTSAGSAATTCTDPHPGYVASDWYTSPSWTVYSAGNAVGAANRITCKYGYVPRIVTIGALGARVTTAGTSNYQLAIYANSSGRPGALLSSTGNITTGSTGVNTAALGANKQVGPGGADTGRDVWWCMNVNDTTTAFMAESASTNSQNANVGSATASDLIPSNTASSINGIHCTGANCNGGSSTFNTWPASLAGSTWTAMSAGTTGNTWPVVIFQAASVP
jgi:hypothetical protein